MQTCDDTSEEEPLLDPDLLTVLCLDCDTIQQIENPSHVCDICAGKLRPLPYDAAMILATALVDLHNQLDYAAAIIEVLHDAVPDEVEEAMQVVFQAQQDISEGSEVEASDYELEFAAAFQWGDVGEA